MDYNTLNRLSAYKDTQQGSAWRDLSYDNRGNVTDNYALSSQGLGFVYDMANQPVEMNKTISGDYVYDGNFKRVKQVVDGTTTYSFYSQSGALLLIDNISNTAEDHDYYHLNGALVLTIKGSDSSYTEEYQHIDHLGSPVAATNNAGNVVWRENFTPYGEKRVNPSQNEDSISYTGHVTDSSGLVYMQARYYDPVIGRFYSNDPVGSVTHLSTANGIHGFNRYAYANNNPFSFIDPDGMQSKPSVNLEEKRERQAAVNTAKAERTVPLSAPSGLGATQMSTAQETHNGLDSQVTQDVISDEASIAKAFCGCDSIQQSVKQFDAASASEFNDGASLQNGVYQTAVAAIPAAHALKAQDVVTGSLAALGASNAVGSLQSAPTVNNGDIVVTTTSMVNGGGRGNVHVSVVRIHQSVN